MQLGSSHLVEEREGMEKGSTNPRHVEDGYTDENASVWKIFGLGGV